MPRCADVRRDCEKTKSETYQVGTVGVHLTSVIVGLDVDQFLIDETDDLNVSGGLRELDALEGTGRDQTGTPARLGAPSDRLALGITDKRIFVGRSPEAEIIGRVDHGGLAEGLGTLGGAVAQVVTGLDTTDEMVVISLVGDPGGV